LLQSDRPQFICIEEPENGLNPKVLNELISVIREQCKIKGHWIWLNTHSQTIVSELRPEEIVLVEKIDGATKLKRVDEKNINGLKMDEAWLTNALNGGLPW
jgi:predicted ATPase